MVGLNNKNYFFIVFLLFFACDPGKRSENQAVSRERHRLQIHFSPKENWMNGPAGLVCVDGLFHAFFPVSAGGANKTPTHWGHAVSPDLIHWEQKQIALYPDSLGSIISGSVVVDSYNSSHFGAIENPPIISIFTYHNYEKESIGDTDIENIGVAYSLDKGDTWVKYENNPVLLNSGNRDFKDPKVFWHEPTKQWIMVLAVSGRIHLYSSKNLKEWVFISEFGKNIGDEEYTWGSPDLFELPVSNGDESKWILTVNVHFGFSGEWFTGYFVGDFDGIRFSSTQNDPQWMDYGNDNNDGSVFNHMKDGRKVWMGWMSNWKYAAEVPTKTWKGSLTIPRRLGLEKVNERYLLTSMPVKELQGLYKEQILIEDIEIAQDIQKEGIYNISSLLPFAPTPLDIQIRFNTDNFDQIGFAEKFGIRFRNTHNESITIGYNSFDGVFYIDRTNSTSEALNKFSGIHFFSYPVEESAIIDMRIILDVSSLEFFAMGGKVVMTEQFFPTSEFDIIELFSENGKVVSKDISITELKSIWD